MARHKRKSRQESTTECTSNSKLKAPPVGPLNPPGDEDHQDRLPQDHHHYHQQEQQDDNDHDTDVPIPVTKKRKKKKSKGKSKRKSLSSHHDDTNDHVDSDNGNDNDNDSDTDDVTTPLEGTMMGDTMVLLDRKKGVVYSAEERREDGTRKPIGTILANGTIQRTATDTQPADPATKSTNSADTGTRNEEPQFPFETDPDDHCESPMDAYQDIVPFLTALQAQKRQQSKNSNTPTHIQIYDPYYCNGAVRRNLASLGFPHVYNEKEDCYQVWNTPGRYPTFDVLITNPPYSGDHLERLMQHLVSLQFGGRDRPWMLLLPQWVHKKEYYIQAMASLGIQPMFVVPHKRYVYVPPPSFRASKRSDVHKKSSPFVSMWYLWGGSHHTDWLSLAKTQIPHCDVARSKNALRDLRRKPKKGG